MMNSRDVCCVRFQWSCGQCFCQLSLPTTKPSCRTRSEQMTFTRPWDPCYEKSARRWAARRGLAHCKWWVPVGPVYCVAATNSTSPCSCHYHASSHYRALRVRAPLLYGPHLKGALNLREICKLSKLRMKSSCSVCFRRSISLTVFENATKMVYCVFLAPRKLILRNYLDVILGFSGKKYKANWLQ